MHRFATNLLVITSICSWVQTMPAMAEVAQTATLRNFDISRRPLGEALSAFAVQSGVEIMFSPADVRRLTSRPLKGRYAPDAALAALLRGTNLAFTLNDKGTYIVQPATNPVPNRKANVGGVAKVEQSPEATANDSFQDIVVTAQRREERLQSVPVSVSAVDEATLTSRGVFETADLAQIVPSLSFTQIAGNTQVRLRGIGTSAFGPGIENPVATYVDGVYIASTASAFFSLGNIQRIEVLRGPQGTLFGRNATGGLVHIITPNPSLKFGGFVRGGFGNYGTVNGDLYATGPVSPTLAADISINYTGQGKGWGKNVNTGSDVNRLNNDLLARTNLLFTPRDSLSLRLSADYAYNHGSTPATLQQRQGDIAYIGTFEKFFTNRLDTDPSNDLPLLYRGGFYDTTNTIDPSVSTKSGGVSLTSTLSIGDAELKSVTAYRRTLSVLSFDLELVPQDVLRDYDRDKWQQFSQELQVSGTRGRLYYTAGLYYFWSRDALAPSRIVFGPDFSENFYGPGITGAVLRLNSTTRTKSIASYAQATYEILPDTKFTFGGRYTNESKGIAGTQSLIANIGLVEVPFVPEGTPFLTPGLAARVKYNNFSYRIALDHQFTRDIMAYVSYSTAFKSGGYNLSSPTNPAFQPEKLGSLEVGLKTELFDRRLRLNLSAFHYNYNNIQVNNFSASSLFITNGPRAKVDGIEAEMQALLGSGFDLSANISYVDHRFTLFPQADFYSIVSGCDTSLANSQIECKGSAKGKRLPGAPTLTGSAGFSYKTELPSGELGANANLFYSNGYYGTSDNFFGTRQRPYAVLNASIYYQIAGDGPRFSLWAKNLLDQKYASNRYISSKQSTYQAAAPLTYGLTVEQKF